MVGAKCFLLIPLDCHLTRVPLSWALFLLVFSIGAYAIPAKTTTHTANTIVLCLMFLFLGFSSWLMLPIRANADVVINENDPSDARSLLAYYNREQYPGVDSPFYGAYYSNTFAPAGEEKDEKPKYEKDEKAGKYIIVNKYKNAAQGPNQKHVGLLTKNVE